MATAGSGLAQQVALAGISNAMAACCTNPMDVIKVRMQMDGEGAAKGSAQRYRGVAHCGAEIFRSEGPQGFYRGIAASVMREMSYSGIRLGLYEPTKQALGATDPKRTSLGLKILSGALTGATGSVLANPFDLVKVRMQSSSASGGREYPSVKAALVDISREGGGIKGLWRGAGPTVQRAALLTASQVPSYDHVKHTLVDGGYMREGYFCHFFCSMVAGVVAAAVTSPVDLVKSRIMVQPVDPATGQGTMYSGMVDCFQRVVQTEGPLALFKGFNSQWLRIGPHTTVSLMAFEQLRHIVGMAYL
eukprot:gnl/TRDRNA2_/TRDRNA2_136143_c0_seq2.p1 gnl/TRDRNA2_/TRDRNA2_136143_c0~~gnl/TRDRNA2_/TRDRNA2_136143_c0_seq2.p1  ORF type:complete len:315 (-),score=50.68 gnl/TRDRNA2_/TRDRNA2_136143_c0_seq2:78-989(-)